MRFIAIYIHTMLCDICCVCVTVHTLCGVDCACPLLPSGSERSILLSDYIHCLCTNTVLSIAATNYIYMQYIPSVSCCCFLFLKWILILVSILYSIVDDVMCVYTCTCF